MTGHPSQVEITNLTVQMLSSHRWQLHSHRVPGTEATFLCLQKVTYNEIKKKLLLRFYSVLDGHIDATLRYVQALKSVNYDDLRLEWLDGMGTAINVLEFAGCQPIKHLSVADYCEAGLHTQTLSFSYKTLTQVHPEGTDDGTHQETNVPKDRPIP